jgi:predicted DNA-binding protein
MKNYYEALKQYIKANHSGNSERMKELESVKNDQKELIKLYNDYKRLSKAMNKPLDESSKMTKSKFKEYIKEIITSTLNEGELEENILAKVTGKSGKSTTISAKNPTELSDMRRQNTNVQNIEPLEELEPNSKQKLKLANKELAFLAKQVRSLEKQLKSKGSDENEG